MSDAPAGTTPVRDHRAAPTGPISRRTQTWFMVGFAAVILIVIIFAHPAPPAAPKTAPPTPSPLTAERLRDYQQRMRTQETPFSAPPAGAVTQAPPSLEEVEEPQPPPDPLAAERAKREYDSLFASPLVYTRRPAESVGQWSPRDPQRRQPALGPAADGPPAPDLDSVAEAVLRATARQSVGAGQSASTEPAAAPPLQAPAGQAGAAQSPATPPINSAGPRHAILEGTIIEAVLSNRLDGAREAPAVCQVSIPVYSHAGDRILIPAGARFIGRTRPVDRLGQSRLEVTFHRLIFPDGRTVPLEQFVALNQRGDLGLRDRVNNHYMSTFGATAVVGVISGATQALANAGVGASADRTIIVAGGADGTSQAAGNVLNRLSSRLPEVTIREGHRIRIYVTRDIELPAYP
jgi:type IV secretion system protein TrbI